MYSKILISQVPRRGPGELPVPHMLVFSCSNTPNTHGTHTNPDSLCEVRGLFPSCFLQKTMLFKCKFISYHTLLEMATSACTITQTDSARSARGRHGDPLQPAASPDDEWRQRVVSFFVLLIRKHPFFMYAGCLVTKRRHETCSFLLKQ